MELVVVVWDVVCEVVLLVEEVVLEVVALVAGAVTSGIPANSQNPDLRAENTTMSVQVVNYIDQ